MATPVALPATARTAARIDPIFVLPLIGAESILAAWFGLDHGLERWQVAADLAVALSFAAAGVTALFRPGPRMSGRLMLGIAVTWWASYLELAEHAGARVAGQLLADVPLILIVWLLLSYPEGRLWSNAARATVVAGWVATAAGGLAAVLLDPGSEDPVGQGTSALGVAVAIATAVLIVVRLVGLPSVRRRVALPLLVAGLLTFPTSLVWLAAQAGGNWTFADEFVPIDRLVAILIPAGYFAGLAWTRVRRSGVSSLVVELQEGGATTLRDRLARTLGDPSLEVAYWIGDGHGWVDGAGQPIALPEPGDRAVTQVTVSGSPIAALVHDPVLLDDPDLVRSVAATAGLVLENERLAAEVRAQLAEVRASRARIVEATDAERQRLERDLHDGAQQRLVGSLLEAQARPDSGRGPECGVDARRRAGGSRGGPGRAS